MEEDSLMKLLTHSVAIGAIAMIGLVAAPVKGQDMNPNKKTYLTFSAPVEVPGATLQPGKYLFQLADLQSNRHIVQIFNEDGSKLIVTTLTVPDRRVEPTGDPVVQFLETPSGAPTAIKSWFYPGDVTGDEFIYPKDQAMRIAKATNHSVLSSDTISGDGIQGMKAEATARINAEGQTVNDKGEMVTKAQAEAESRPSAATPEVTPTTPPPPPAETQTAQSTPAPSTPEMSTPSRDRSSSANASNRPARPVGTSGRSELPHTASNTPLIGLIGVLSLIAAVSVRTFARNRG
jgi:hypothetical protein